jgi:nanoRNase/pAp phosphatase (c-di-AMP/oligoRNAs hydrolase)
MQPNSTLILTALNYLDFDKLISAFVLAKAWEQRHQGLVTVLLPTTAWQKLAEEMSGVNVNTVDGVRMPANQLRIDNVNTAVDAIEWKIEGSSLVLNLISYNGQVIDPAQLKLQTAKFPYNQIVAIDILDQAELERVLGLPAHTLKDTEIINLQHRDSDARFGNSSFISKDSNICCDLVYKYLSANNFQIDTTLATALLAGIYWRTNSLQNYFTNAAVLDTCRHLLRLGGRLSSVVNKVFASLTPIERTLWQEALQNAELMGGAQIAFSTVTRETAFEYNKALRVSPVHNPLYYLDNVIGSFLFLPLADHYTEVICSSVDKDLNLRKLFKDYKLRGDSLQAQVNLNMGLEQARNLVWKLLSTQLNIDTPEPAAEHTVTSTEATPDLVDKQDPAVGVDTVPAERTIPTVSDDIVEPQATTQPSDSDTPTTATSPENSEEDTNRQTALQFS